MSWKHEKAGWRVRKVSGKKKTAKIKFWCSSVFILNG
jgi:hypothetical protein